MLGEAAKVSCSVPAYPGSFVMTSQTGIWRRKYERLAAFISLYQHHKKVHAFNLTQTHDLLAIIALQDIFQKHRYLLIKGSTDFISLLHDPPPPTLLSVRFSELIRKTSPLPLTISTLHHHGVWHVTHEGLSPLWRPQQHLSMPSRSYRRHAAPATFVLVHHGQEIRVHGPEQRRKWCWRTWGKWPKVLWTWLSDKPAHQDRRALTDWSRTTRACCPSSTLMMGRCHIMTSTLCSRITRYAWGFLVHSGKGRRCSWVFSFRNRCSLAFVYHPRIWVPKPHNYKIG